MSIFNFFTRKSKKDESPIEIECVTQCENTDDINHADENINITQKEDIIQEPSKDVLLKDFFKVDITTIRPDEGETRIILQEPELGMFHYIDFHITSDGTINLELLSLYKRFSKETIDLINLCAQKFGPTKAGETVITSRDEILLVKGLFSRMWKDIWFDVTTDWDTGLKALSLTIFNVEKTGFMKMSSFHK